MEIEALGQQADDLPRILFWELLQNLPLVAGFLLGLELWQRGQPWLAVLCMASGSVVGSLFIWATEARIVAGHREPLGVILANVVVITALMAVLVVYLSAPWSRWWMDLIVGVLAGTALGAAQDLAARTPVGLGHCAAMATAFALGLVGIRLFSAVLPLWLDIAFIASVVTVAIVWIDYGTSEVSGVQERNVA